MSRAALGAADAEEGPNQLRHVLILSLRIDDRNSPSWMSRAALGAADADCTYINKHILITFYYSLTHPLGCPWQPWVQQMQKKALLPLHPAVPSQDRNPHQLPVRALLGNACDVVCVFVLCLTHLHVRVCLRRIEFLIGSQSECFWAAPVI